MHSASSIFVFDVAESSAAIHLFADVLHHDTLRLHHHRGCLCPRPMHWHHPATSAVPKAQKSPSMQACAGTACSCSWRPTLAPAQRRCSCCYHCYCRYRKNTPLLQLQQLERLSLTNCCYAATHGRYALPPQSLTALTEVKLHFCAERGDLVQQNVSTDAMSRLPLRNLSTFAGAYANFSCLSSATGQWKRTGGKQQRGMVSVADTGLLVLVD